ncbi:MAG: metallophosphoesterase [Ignavibacteriaceae bacterium]|jgi:predicted MPP superfamily phosphohydrolase|nr:metallophosphoesterase [Ignavibacteriaceae bacterium]
MKLLLVADLHLGESRPSSTHEGIIRQANSQASKKLSELIPFFNSQRFDLIFQMGDIVRETGDRNLDAPFYKNVFSLLSSFNKPLINLLGNHELNTFTLEELKQFYIQSNLDSNFFGSKIINCYQIIWLDHQINSEGRQYLSDERLEWLDKEINPDYQTILVSHYSIISNDMRGNFLFEDKPQDIYYANSEDILDILKKKEVILSISGHSHWISYKTKDNINFLSVPSFSENIAAENYPDNNPAIYTILETFDSSLYIKSFSGKFCFFSLEI